MTEAERLEKVEKRLAELDAIFEKLVIVASAHPFGRMLLKTLGLR